MENDIKENMVVTAPLLGNERVRVFENYKGEERVSITCIYGPFRSGKSTLVQDLLESMPNAVVLDEDMMRAYVFQNEEKDSYLETVSRIAYYFAAQGNDVILDFMGADKVFDKLEARISAVNEHMTKVTRRSKAKKLDIMLRKVCMDKVITFAR